VGRLNHRPIILVGIAAILFYPITAFAHHISMSFSNWEFEEKNVSVVFRIPLADAIWGMNPNLVAIQESLIRIKVPVDNALKASVNDFLLKTIPQKISLNGCIFDPNSIQIIYDKNRVQIRAGLSCLPGYLENPELNYHFLVDENRLHTSLATLNFPGKVRQCIFRSGQFTCDAVISAAVSKTAPARQAMTFFWWDYVVLGAALLMLISSVKILMVSLTFFFLGNAFAPITYNLGLPVPSIVILFPILSALSIYMLCFVYAASSKLGRKARICFISFHILILFLAWTEFIRLTPLMVVALSLLSTSVMYADYNRGHATIVRYQVPNGPLFLLVLSFGLIHGFILLQTKSLYGPSGLTDTGPLLFLALFMGMILIWPAKKIIDRFQIQTQIAVGMILVGIIIFAMRNINLPFSTFSYDNAGSMLRNLVQSNTVGPTILPVVLLMAVFIGGLHAVTPGHGKTIVAAYLIGTKGRMMDAVILGFIVTIAHTFMVIVLAILALSASKYILPDQLVPWMSGLSGLLIFGLGIFLFQLRLRNYIRFGNVAAIPKFNKPENGSNHVHKKGNHHDHHHKPEHDRIISHTHDGIHHTHVFPDKRTGLWSLAALGITGGIVPCPDALAILLIAISLNKLLLGLLVIVAFSVGLAIVLIAIGIATVKFRPLMERFTGQGKITSFWLPVVSAILISILGAVMVWKAWPGL